MSSLKGPVLVYVIRIFLQLIGSLILMLPNHYTLQPNNDHAQ